jgi:hypothetical protein
MGELQGREITMSRLHDWLVTALNENNVTARAALTHPAFSGGTDASRLLAD